MGIHDRDYSRPDRAAASVGGLPAGAFRPRGWSVNTWLIAICVAVFVVDQFLPRMLAFLSPVAVAQMPDGRFREVPPAATIDDPVRDVGLRVRTLDSVGPKDVVYTSPAEGVFVPVLDARARIARGERVFYPLASGGEFSYFDDAGNRRSSKYTVLAQVIAAGPIWTFGYFSTAKALMYWSGSSGLTGFEFWRFITFQFLHANLSHLLFNMLGLYFFGSIVEQYLGSKRYLAFYLLCGIAGAAMYLALNFLGWSVLTITGRELPLLLVNNPGTPLVGASAGVFGVILACAFLVPNAMVLLFFVIPMRLATLAYGLVAVALFTVFFGRNNAGGEAAHLGGAIAGWWFIRHPHSLHGFFDFLGRYDPTSRSGAAYRAGRVRSKGGSTLDDAEIDRILAKIHDQGLQSLTAKEKRALREASKR
jgi:membrane associated rhomboid family serine protease